MRQIQQLWQWFRSLPTWLIPGILLLAGCIILFQNNLVAGSEQHFVFLARSFLEGQLYFTNMPGHWGDTALFEGHYFWPLGPLPALLLMPFVALFGSAMQQGYLMPVLHLLNLFLLYKIAYKITAKKHISLWLSFAYIFSTAYLYVALKPWSWYFAQVLAGTFLLLALYEFFHKKRWWLIGIYLGLGMMTRINIIGAGIFFGLFLLLGKKIQIDKKLSQLFQLCLPVVIGIILLLVYNYLRFGSLFEFGYNYQLLYNEPAANREYGLWNFLHFPANFYYLFLKGPEAVALSGTKLLTYPFLRPDIWGMSILFTSPILLWGLKASFKKPVVRYALLTSAVMLFLLLGYYGIGVRQYGYRYALDFYPFLFIILALASKTNLTLPMKIIIVLSFLFNWYLIPFV